MEKEEDVMMHSPASDLPTASHAVGADMPLGTDMPIAAMPSASELVPITTEDSPTTTTEGLSSTLEGTSSASEATQDDIGKACPNGSCSVDSRMNTMSADSVRDVLLDAYEESKDEKNSLGSTPNPHPKPCGSKVSLFEHFIVVGAPPETATDVGLKIRSREEASMPTRLMKRFTSYVMGGSSVNPSGVHSNSFAIGMPAAGSPRANKGSTTLSIASQDSGDTNHTGGGSMTGIRLTQDSPAKPITDGPHGIASDAGTNLKTSPASSIANLSLPNLGFRSSFVSQSNSQSSNQSGAQQGTQPGMVRSNSAYSPRTPEAAPKTSNAERTDRNTMSLSRAASMFSKFTSFSMTPSTNTYKYNIASQFSASSDGRTASSDVAVPNLNARGKASTEDSVDLSGMATKVSSESVEEAEEAEEPEEPEEAPCSDTGASALPKEPKEGLPNISINTESLEKEYTEDALVDEGHPVQNVRKSESKSSVASAGEGTARLSDDPSSPHHSETSSVLGSMSSVLHDHHSTSGMSRATSHMSMSSIPMHLHTNSKTSILPQPRGSKDTMSICASTDAALLYRFPKTVDPPPAEVLDFCMPLGGRVQRIPPRDENIVVTEILYGKSHSQRNGRCFVFIIEDKTIDNTATEDDEAGTGGTKRYGICVIHDRLLSTVLNPTNGNDEKITYNFQSPMCYAFITRFPLFDFFFQALFDMITAERLERMELIAHQDTEFTDEMALGCNSYRYLPHHLLEEILERLTAVPPPKYNEVIGFMTGPSITPIEMIRLPPTGDLSEHSIASADWALPSLLSWMPVETLIWALSLLLSESKIIIIGTEPGMVSCGVMGMLALIRPLAWTNPLIPVLPMKLIDFVESPVPIIAGLVVDTYTRHMHPRDLIERCNDLDNGTVTAVLDMSAREIFVSALHHDNLENMLMPGSEALADNLKECLFTSADLALSRNSQRSRPVYSINPHQKNEAKVVQSKMEEHMKTVVEIAYLTYYQLKRASEDGGSNRFPSTFSGDAESYTNHMESFDTLGGGGGGMPTLDDVESPDGGIQHLARQASLSSFMTPKASELKKPADFNDEPAENSYDLGPADQPRKGSISMAMDWLRSGTKSAVKVGPDDTDSPDKSTHGSKHNADQRDSDTSTPGIERTSSDLSAQSGECLTPSGKGEDLKALEDYYSGFLNISPRGSPRRSDGSVPASPRREGSPWKDLKEANDKAKSPHCEPDSLDDAKAQKDEEVETERICETESDQGEESINDVPVAIDDDVAALTVSVEPQSKAGTPSPGISIPPMLKVWKTVRKGSHTNSRNNSKTTSPRSGTPTAVQLAPIEPPDVICTTDDHSIDTSKDDMTATEPIPSTVERRPSTRSRISTESTLTSKSRSIDEAGILGPGAFIDTKSNPKRRGSSDMSIGGIRSKIVSATMLPPPPTVDDLLEGSGRTSECSNNSGTTVGTTRESFTSRPSISSRLLGGLRTPGGGVKEAAAQMDNYSTHSNMSSNTTNSMVHPATDLGALGITYETDDVIPLSKVRLAVSGNPQTFIRKFVRTQIFAEHIANECGDDDEGSWYGFDEDDELEDCSDTEVGDSKKSTPVLSRRDSIRDSESSARNSFSEKVPSSPAKSLSPAKPSNRPFRRRSSSLLRKQSGEFSPMTTKDKATFSPRRMTAPVSMTSDSSAVEEGKPPPLIDHKKPPSSSKSPIDGISLIIKSGKLGFATGASNRRQSNAKTPRFDSYATEGSNRLSTGSAASASSDNSNPDRFLTKARSFTRGSSVSGGRKMSMSPKHSPSKRRNFSKSRVKSFDDTSYRKAVAQTMRRTSSESVGLPTMPSPSVADTGVEKGCDTIPDMPDMIDIGEIIIEMPDSRRSSAVSLEKRNVSFDLQSQSGNASNAPTGN